MKRGIFPDLSNEDYHSDLAISRSGIMEFKKSPLHYHSYRNSKRTKEQTPAMIFGSAFHAYILEYHKFEEDYVIEPARVLLKDSGREAYNEYKKYIAEIESSGKIVLSEADHSKILEMGYFVTQNEQVRQLLYGGQNECSFFWTDEETGLHLKAKPDILHDNMIVDLKTCADASPRAFQYAMVDGGYHIQAAMVRDAIRALKGKDLSNVLYVAVEKTYPYCTGIYILDEYSLDEGERQYKQLLVALKSHIADNHWPSYEPQTISLPKWATYE